MAPSRLGSRWLGSGEGTPPPHVFPSRRLRCLDLGAPRLSGPQYKFLATPMSEAEMEMGQWAMNHCQ